MRGGRKECVVYVGELPDDVRITLRLLTQIVLAGGHGRPAHAQAKLRNGDLQVREREVEDLFYDVRSRLVYASNVCPWGVTVRMLGSMPCPKYGFVMVHS